MSQHEFILFQTVKDDASSVYNTENILKNVLSPKEIKKYQQGEEMLPRIANIVVREHCRYLLSKNAELYSNTKEK